MDRLHIYFYISSRLCIYSHATIEMRRDFMRRISATRRKLKEGDG